jgi:hypothetical protein
MIENPIRCDVPVSSEALARAWNCTDVAHKQMAHFIRAKGSGAAITLSVHNNLPIQNRISVYRAGGLNYVSL